MVAPAAASVEARAAVPVLPGRWPRDAGDGRGPVVPHRGNYELFRLGELRSLCVECHNAFDANNRAPVRLRSPVRVDGSPSDPRHPWNRYDSKG